MATFNYNKANLAAAQIPSAITASQTSITVDASESALFPTVPFFATIMPAGGVPNTLNSEIVQVTAVDTASGALTITRAQRGTTAKAQDEGAVIMNGVYIEDLAQSQAVGKSFFSATLSSGVYYIQDALLTTTPEDGDSIRVVFGSNWTSGTPKLSLNSGTSYNIYAGNNLTADHGTTNTPAMVKSGAIYELTYYNGAWYILNLTANSSITSDNVDWASFIDKIYPVGAIYSSVSHATAWQVKTALGGVGTWVAWGSGRVPVGVDESDSSFNLSEKTGGSKYIQDHTHDIRWGGRNESRVLMSHNVGSVKAFDLTGWQSVNANMTDTNPVNLMAGKIHNTTANFGLMTTGNAGNLQPYITCFMWKRTA